MPSKIYYIQVAQISLCGNETVYPYIIYFLISIHSDTPCVLLCLYDHIICTRFGWKSGSVAFNADHLTSICATYEIISSSRITVPARIPLDITFARIFDGSYCYSQLFNWQTVYIEFKQAHRVITLYAPTYVYIGMRNKLATLSPDEIEIERNRRQRLYRREQSNSRTSRAEIILTNRMGRVPPIPYIEGFHSHEARAAYQVDYKRRCDTRSYNSLAFSLFPISLQRAGSDKIAVGERVASSIS